MKFLRDLKILNDAWYKQYLTSRISETGSIVADTADEEEEQEDEHEFKFRSSADEDFDLEAFNELFEKKKSQSDIDEQRRQAYLAQIKKRKNQIKSSESKQSVDEDKLQFSVNLDDINKPKDMDKDQSRVIEQFFPNASTLGPQLLVPDEQEHTFFELDFAKTQNIDEYLKQHDREQRRDIKRQTKKHRDSIEGEESFASEIKDDEEKEQASTWQIPSDEKILTKELSKRDESETSSRSSKIDEKDTQQPKDEFQKPSIKTLSSISSFTAETVPSSVENLLEKAASIIVPNTFEEIAADVSNSLKQLTDDEQMSLKEDLELARHNVDQWLQQTLQHHEQIRHIDNYNDDKSLLKNQSLTNELSVYLGHELEDFNKKFLSVNLNKHLNDPKLANLLRQRMNEIKTVLQETKNHQEILQQVQQQINHIDQMMNEQNLNSNQEDTLQKLDKSKQDFNEIKNQEYLQIQPLLRTRLELAIRTLDADLELIEQILNGQTLPDLNPTMSLIATKIASQPPIESDVYKDMKRLRNDLSTIVKDIKTSQIKPTSQDLFSIDTSERLQAIRQEYSEQKLNQDELKSIKLDIDKLVEFDQEQTKSFDRLKEIHQKLDAQSKKIQRNLSNIMKTRSYSNHPQDALAHARLKVLPNDDSSGTVPLVIVENKNRPISKPIPIDPSINIADCKIATFLYDDKIDQKVLLTPEQYLITKQQDEFTSRKFVTYIIDKVGVPISEPIQPVDTEMEKRNAFENTIFNKLELFDNNRHKLTDLLENKQEILNDILNEYELIYDYVQDRTDKLKTEEKVIELILPILEKFHNHISDDQLEYKHEQSNMDYLLSTIKSIVQLDEELTEYRKNKPNELSEIEKLENNLIHQLTEISTHLDDPSILNQVQNLTNHLQGSQLLTKLQPIILSGIKTRAKQIQHKCENLLFNIHKNSNELMKSVHIRDEYIQFLNKRFHEQMEQERDIENLYENIERMQYNFYQTMADSSETIKLEDLDNEIKDKYKLNQITIPDSIQTENDKLIYKFNGVLESLHDELTTNEKYKTILLNEMERFQSNDSQNSYSEQINYLKNELEIQKNKKLLKYIEKLKILLNKLETIEEKNLQYDFLDSKLDQLYEIFLNKYQIQLPNKTDIELIRTTLNNIRKKAKKDLEKYDLTKNDSTRKLDIFKKKKELSQRTKITSITPESQLSSLNAYIQQSIIEPTNIHHEFYAMKIEQITKDFVSLFHNQTSEQQLSMMDSLNRTLDRLKNYSENLDQQRKEYENELISNKHQLELINKIQLIINESFNQLQSLLISNSEQDTIHKLSKETVIDTAEDKHVYSEHLFQLETKAFMTDETSLETFVLQPASAVDIQKDLNQSTFSNDSKIQILQNELNYLRKQYGQAIAIGDFSQKIAIERAISHRLQILKSLHDKQKIPEINQTETSVEQPTIGDKSLITNPVDQQIRRVLKQHIKHLQKRLQNEKYKGSTYKRIIHSVEELQQLNKELKAARHENNRQIQIDVQLEILDKIKEQSDDDSIDQNTLEDLRKQLEQEKQDLFILESDAQSYKDSHTQSIPSLAQLSESSHKSTIEQKVIPSTGELLVEADSIERLFSSIITINPKELYEELKKIRSSIEEAFENSQMSLDTVAEKSSLVLIPIKSDTGVNTIILPDEDREKSSPIQKIHSSVFPIDDSHDSTSIFSPKSLSDHEDVSSTLSLPDNDKQYSITQTKAKDQQIVIPIQQLIFPPHPDYGNVYVRQRPIDISSPDINTDGEERLRQKIQRKQRLVKFGKTRQGNTVIHRRIAPAANVFIAPQQALYEENLQAAPPLVYVNDRTSTSSQIVDTKKNLYQSQKSHSTLPFHSASNLSPVEEESEEEEGSDITYGIAFSLTNKDSTAKKYTSDEKDKNTDLLTLPTTDDEKSSGKLSTPQQISSTSSTATKSNTLQPIKTTQPTKIDQNKRVTLFTDLSTTSNISELQETPTSKESKTIKKKSLEEKDQLSPVEPTEDIQLPTNDESYSTQAFDIEQTSQQPTSITPKSTVIYHKVGGKSKTRKTKKSQQKDTRKIGTKTKRQILTPPPPLVLAPRKAVPFISATKDKQINVEEDVPIKSRKKNKSSSPKKKKRKHKKDLDLIEKSTDGLPFEPKSIKNQDAITNHLLDVKRFPGPPISPIHFDQTVSKNDDTFEKSRPNFLKPMVKNFELDTNRVSKDNTEIHSINACDFDKDLFDFTYDTKDIDHPAMFTEYIPELFEKQIEEKQTRRISLTAVQTDEQLMKRLAPRISRLYNGWQSSDVPCAHTDQFHPLNKHFMTDLSYYFDEEFIDGSNLFKKQKDIDKLPSQIKQTTKRFRDDYLVKEFFSCWNDYAKEKARIAELRRKRLTIDFREFWYQDALSDPFYSYFEQPLDYLKKQNHQHQLAYRLHKRLVRTGREQPKETMKEKNRSSFLPTLFNLPKNYLDRQESLSRRRRQLMDYTNRNEVYNHTPLVNVITKDDEVLPLIRERLNLLNRTINQINQYQDELAIKQILLNSSLIEQGTIDDLDKLIMDYYGSIEEQNIKTTSISSNDIVKLPLLKRKSSQKTVTIN